MSSFWNRSVTQDKFPRSPLQQSVSLRHFKAASSTALPKTGLPFFSAKFRAVSIHSKMIGVEKPSEETGNIQMGRTQALPRREKLRGGQFNIGRKEVFQEKGLYRALDYFLSSSVFHFLVESEGGEVWWNRSAMVPLGRQRQKDP